MKHLSIIALLAALATPLAVQAQDVSISTEVSASGEVSVSTPDVSSVVSEVSSAVSSAVSEASSELSSAVSEASSEMSSEMSSSASMESSDMMTSCDSLDASLLALIPVDEAKLAAVTSVTVFAVDDCSGLGDLAALDAGALTTLETNQMVIDALAAQGESGAEIIAYSFDDTSLTVYVRERK